MLRRRPAPPRWRLIGQSIRGASHERSGAPNQDAYALYPPSGEGATVACAVADGHGGTKYFRSEIGARIAVDVALQMVEGILQTLPPDGLKSQHTKNQIAETLASSIVGGWQAAVEEHRKENLATQAEASIWAKETNQDLERRMAPQIAYGSTLLVTAVVRDEILFAQLGDGDILLVSDTGEAIPVFTAEADMLGGETTSLVSPDAIKRARVGFWNRPEVLPAMIMLSTDGYSNSFPDAPSFHQVASDIWEMTIEGNWDKVQATLPEWLTETTRKGSGDDITVALIARGDV